LILQEAFMHELNLARVAQAKWAFTTRRADRTAARSLITDLSTRPSAGDLVLTASPQSASTALSN
jgi:hypothetical protein